MVLKKAKEIESVLKELIRTLHEPQMKLMPLRELINSRESLMAFIDPPKQEEHKVSKF
jgi:hypothetical protein